MRRCGARLTALLLAGLLTTGAAGGAAYGESGAGLEGYEQINLEQMVVLTPQEEVAPADAGGQGKDAGMDPEPAALFSSEQFGGGTPAAEDGRDESVYSSPLAAAAGTGSSAGTIFVADHTVKCIRVIRTSDNSALSAIALEKAPNALKVSDDGSKLYVAAGGAQGTIYVIDTAAGAVTQTLKAGHTPSALELSENGGMLYVANRFSGTLQIIDLSSGTTAAEFAVTREPMSMVRVGNKLFLASHLITGSAQQDVVSSDVVCIDLGANDWSADSARTTIKLLNGSTNVKAMAASPDGKYLYVSHALGRYNVATTQADRGWIYNNALTEIRVADGAVTAVMMLDDLDWGAGNPWGVAVTDTQIAVAISGTHELMLIDRAKMRAKIDGVTDGSYWNGKNAALKYQGFLQNKDDIANDLTFLTEMKTRVKLGQDGPRGIAVSGDQIYTANYFSGSVSAVSLDGSRKTTIAFDSAAEDDVRTGERLWNDATIGYQQWQSCASCHPDARVDGLNWDNLNDGIGTPKQARSMLYTFKRGRVMATGIRANAKVAVRAGLKYIMFNANYPEEELLKIDAYLQDLKPEASPYLEEGRLSESALRGKALFEGEAGCAGCHSGALKGKDTLIYNYTQTGNETRGLLVPPLVEAWRTAPYLYDGRAATVKEVLTIYNPGYRSGEGKHGDVNGLSEAQLDDLSNYVMSLSTESDTLAASSSSLDFGIVKPGYESVAAKAVTIGGFEPGELAGATAIMKEGSAFILTAGAIEGRDELSLEIRPKDGLGSGSYTDYALVTAPGGASAAVTLRFAVGGVLTVTGSAVVGEYLSVADELDGAYRYQWYRGASEDTMTPIGNATQKKYLLSDIDEGYRISVRAEAPGKVPGGSVPTDPVRRLGSVVSLIIEGKPAVGQTVAAKLSGTGNQYTFEWLSDGTAVGDQSAYTIRTEDAGRELVLRASCAANGSQLTAGPVAVPSENEALVTIRVTDNSGAAVADATVTATEITAAQTASADRAAAAAKAEGAAAGAKAAMAAGRRALMATTDSAGRAYLALGSGSYTITVSKNGENASQALIVSEEDVAAGGSETALELAKAAEYSLSGSYSAAGEYGAMAELIDQRGTVVSASDNRSAKDKTFRLSAPAGTYTLKISKPGHLSVTVTEIPVTGDLDVSTILELTPGDVRADRNERVDFLDIAAMAGAFANRFRLWDVPDIDGDGAFTASDLNYVRENYGKEALHLSWSQLGEKQRLGEAQ